MINNYLYNIKSLTVGDKLIFESACLLRQQKGRSVVEKSKIIIRMGEDDADKRNRHYTHNILKELEVL